MSMDYIKDTYRVPAKRGGRVEYTYGGSRFGTITGADGARLRIRLDGEIASRVFHPTWELKYLDAVSDPTENPALDRMARLDDELGEQP